MSAEDNREKPDKPVEVTRLSVLSSHLLWIAVGPLMLIALLWGIASAGSGWVTVLDIVFFVVVGVMILGRWLDQRSGQGTTSTGESATWRDFRRYVASLSIVAVAAWLAANVLGNHILDGG